ncbi:polyketide synthase [Nocardia sp. NPDC004654]|uniref:beta-ketoacyl [acyl carrier protein] synthase domain-containing protein n=1 Tax=Nocardia sp. NPDC004654 TaxID=3154776 RepID=UPI0033B02672
MNDTDLAPAPQPADAALRRATETIRRLREELTRRSATGPIAVVGVGLRLAGGITDLESLWTALREGRNLVADMPIHRRWPFEDEWSRLPTMGSFIDDALHFDPEFFGISPRAAQAIDPQHRLLLETTWDAMAHAGLEPAGPHEEPIGTFVGITGRFDYADWSARHVDAHAALGNGHSFAAGRIAYTFGFTGPAIAFDTACSSSLVAIHHAIQSLRRGECAVAVAGGVNLVLAPNSTRLIDQTGTLAPDGLCKSFDARANGYVRGEGCATVVLKRLADAERDGDRILGVIHGSAVNQDGRSSGFTAPNARAQQRVIESALDDAGCSAADIGMVEAHGTGTSLGDPIEMSGIVAALGARNGGRALHVGTLKTNLGHLEAAAGVVGLVKALLCARERVVPPLVHFGTLNPRITLDGTDIRVSEQSARWSTDDSGPLAGVSAFGIIGTNAHVIVGPAPAQAADGAPNGRSGVTVARRARHRVVCVPAFLGEPPAPVPAAR